MSVLTPPIPAPLPAPAIDAPPARTARWTVEGRRTLALFLVCLGFYLLTASGHFYAADEETVYRVTESLVERHTFAVPDTWGVIGTQRDAAGALYAQYTPGQSLVALPLYVLGKALAYFFPADQEGFITRFYVSLLNAFVTAATVALLYRLGRLLRYGGAAALALALIYAVASGAWPHGRTFFAEPLTALLLLLSFALIESWVVSRESREGTVSNTPTITPTADPLGAHGLAIDDRRPATFPLTDSRLTTHDSRCLRPRRVRGGRRQAAGGDRAADPGVVFGRARVGDRRGGWAGAVVAGRAGGDGVGAGSGARGRAVRPL